MDFRRWDTYQCHCAFFDFELDLTGLVFQRDVFQAVGQVNDPLVTAATQSARIVQALDIWALDQHIHVG